LESDSLGEAESVRVGLSSSIQQPNFPPKKKFKCLAAKSKLNKEKFRSKNREDTLLDHHIFHGRTGGIFLEIGGFDGINYSNSWYFEQSLCWRGILIEGLPRSFEKMQVNRPLAVNIGRAVCHKPGIINYLDSEHSATAGLESHMEANFMDQWHRSSKKIDVCCNPMRDIVCATQVPYINLLIIDVEGAEELILQTVDWENISVEVIMVETDSRYMKNDKVTQIRKFLEPKGFELLNEVNILHSTVFRSTNFSVEEIDVIAWSKYAIRASHTFFGSKCNYGSAESALC